jgi:ligand-binding SRPBCC domain-containing protein
MMKRFLQEQILDVDLEELWSFVSSPSNLSFIIPKWLDFRLVSESKSGIFNGQLIEYDIKLPLLGRRQWVSEIKHIEPCYCFVDEQKIGPYRFWHHYHELQKVDDTRTRMVDLVSYDVGWGLFGRMVDHFYVQKNIREIFTCRKEALARMFNAS